VIAGILLTLLGIIGSLLPIMPGIPFFVGALVCFSKSSEKFYNLLLNNPLIGPVLKNYQVHHGLKREWKALIIFVQWTIVAVVAIFVVPFLWARLLTIFFALVGTIFVLSLKTAKN
jgi:hypothetical protein